MEVARIHERSRAQEQGKSKRATKVQSSESTAGIESFPKARVTIAGLVEAEANLAEILSAVNEVGSIPVFNFTFAPREVGCWSTPIRILCLAPAPHHYLTHLLDHQYVRQHLIKFFRSFVNSFIQEDGQLVRPSSIMRKLSCCYRALQKASTYGEKIALSRHAISDISDTNNFHLLCWL